MKEVKMNQLATVRDSEVFIHCRDRFYALLANAASLVLGGYLITRLPL